MSQVWRRGGLVNPSEKIISYKDFCEGELNSQIISIFGQERYDALLVAVKRELEKSNP
jgi:hypothetical protein